MKIQHFIAKVVIVPPFGIITKYWPGQTLLYLNRRVNEIKILFCILLKFISKSKDIGNAQGWI